MYYETDYLSHHGVIGMKWGVRRYQNTDGTLTAKGKRHRKDYAAEAREMSDDELREKVNRLNLEKQYKDMAYEQSSRTKKLSALSEGTKKGAAVSNNLSNAQQKKEQQKKEQQNKEQQNGKKKGQQPQQNPKVLNSTSQLLQNASNLSRTRDRAAGDKAVKSMDLSKMSDDELRNAVNRRRMEQQYASLKQEDIKRGKRTMSNFLETSANTIIVTTSAITVAKSLAPYAKYVKALYDLR